MTIIIGFVKKDCQVTYLPTGRRPTMTNSCKIYDKITKLEIETNSIYVLNTI